MTTPNIEELVADFPEINPANYGDDEVNALNAWGCAAHDALQSQAERIKELEAELSRTDVLLEECKMDWSGDVIQIKAEHKYEIETLRAQLAVLQSDDELPEPALFRGGKLMPFEHRYFQVTGMAEKLGYTQDRKDYYTADQLRQAQAKVRAKMVPLEKDAARLDWLEQDHLGRMFYIVNNWYTLKSYGMPWTKRKDLRAAIDAAMGITGEPK